MNQTTTAARRFPETPYAKKIEDALLKLARKGQTLGMLMVFPEKTLAKAEDLSEEDKMRVQSAVDGFLLALAMDREANLMPGVKSLLVSLPHESQLHIISVMADDRSWKGIAPAGDVNRLLHTPLFLNTFFG